MRLMSKILLFAAALALSCATTAHQTPRGKVALNPAYFAETISIGSTVNSTALRTNNIFLVGYSISTAGTATGTWGIQYSNDNVTWDTYTLSTTPPAATGSPQVFGIVIDNYEFAFIRILFSGTGGSGSATIVAVTK